VDALAGYTLIVDLDVPSSGFDEQGHVNNVAVLELFQVLRRRYMGDVIGRRDSGLIPADAVVGVRELICRYESELMPGEAVRGGCRIVGRSERSYLFDEQLVVGERVIARCKVLECVVDRSAARAMPIPETLWTAIEAAEGRAMAPGALPFPRSDW
jgi:acyl-CoA thioesterase FadM